MTVKRFFDRMKRRVTLRQKVYLSVNKCIALTPAFLFVLALAIVLQFLFTIQRIPLFLSTQLGGPVIQRQVITRPFDKSTSLVMDWLFQYDRNLFCLSTALLLLGNVTLFLDAVSEEFGRPKYALDRLQVNGNIRASNLFPNRKCSY
jgi:hypothetical protein